MSEPEIVPVAAALGMSFDVTIAENRRLVVQTHLPADAEGPAINAMMDKVFKALDRQTHIYTLRALRPKLASLEKTLRQINEDMGRVETRIQAEWAASSRRGELKLSPKEQAEKTNASSTRDRYKLEIELVKAEIAECEAAINATD